MILSSLNLSRLNYLSLSLFIRDQRSTNREITIGRTDTHGYLYNLFQPFSITLYQSIFLVFFFRKSNLKQILKLFLCGVIYTAMILSKYQSFLPLLTIFWSNLKFYKNSVKNNSVLNLSPTLYTRHISWTFYNYKNKLNLKFFDFITLNSNLRIQFKKQWLMIK